jgi:hypothetical protein
VCEAGVKVFISWSGTVSHEVALALRDWLPKVRQSIEPYVSSEDIDKGVRWNLELANQLQDTDYGILCVTKENYQSSWLNFEAGALSKLASGRVTPFLIDLRATDISGPLAQFHATAATHKDVLSLVRALSERSGPPSLGERELEEIVEVWWPRLEAKLEEIRTQLPPTSSIPARDERGILEEVLALVRAIHRDTAAGLVAVEEVQAAAVASREDSHPPKTAAVKLLALALREVGIPEDEFFVRLTAPAGLSVYVPLNLAPDAKLMILEYAKILGFDDVDIKPVPGPGQPPGMASEPPGTM